MEWADIQHIEGFYNQTRRHSTLGYLSPKDYEQASLNQRINEPEKSHMVAVRETRGLR